MSGTLSYILQTLPSVLAVVSGPLVAILCRFAPPSGGAMDGLSLAQVIRGTLCAWLFVSLFVSGKLPLLTHPLARPLLLLAACAALTAPVCPYPQENLVFAVKLVFLILIFANVFHLAQSRQLDTRGLALWAWALLLILGVSTGAGLATGQVVAEYGSRYATGGLIGQPMQASFLLLSILPVFICRLVQHRSAVAGLLLLFVSLFFTMRRSALIAGGAAIACAFLINFATWERRLQQRTVLAFLALLLVQWGLGWGTGAGVDLAQRFRDLDPARGTGSGRYVFWRLSLDHIRERPLPTQVLGEGVGSIRKVMEQRFGMPIGSHSDWLDLVNNLGLCGLVGISWWHGELARFVWRLRGRRDGPFQGACAAALVLALISAGTGGAFEPCWTLSYAALGFWAGGVAQPPVGPAASATRELYA